MILCCYDFTFNLSFQIFPWQQYELVVLSKMLSIRTSNALDMLYVAFSFFSTRTFLILPLCVECLHYLCHCSYLIGFLFPCNNCCSWIVEFIIGRLLTWLLKTFTNWSSVYFVFRYSLYVASNCPLPPSFFFALPIRALLFYICRIHTLFSVAESQKNIKCRSLDTPFIS